MDKKTNDLVLKIQDFRAIKNAEIILDGITVVAGVNGSGKSTISKVLYHFLKTVIHYDEVLKRVVGIETNNILSQTLGTIELILSMLLEDINNKDIESIGSKKELLLTYVLNNNIDERFNPIDEYIDILNKIIKRIQLDKNDNRIEKWLKYLENQSNLKADNLIDMSVTLKQRLHEMRQFYLDLTKERPLDILQDNFIAIFNEIPNVNIHNAGIEIANHDSSKLLFLSQFSNIAYFDSPMLLGVIPEKEGFEHWEDLNKILSKSKYNGGVSSDLNFNKSISDIIGGNTSLDDNFGQSFIYQRKDGKRFNLLDCATGLKSFSMIQMLVQNGFIGKRTLLIIDEPEAHLHPQWVVEYARLLVLLNKHTGCKFLIASHHPDMISALKYISKAEDTQDNFNLYFAEESDEEYKYNFVNQNGKLERVFESLNIGLDKIEEYGRDYEEE